jgi:membrane protein DedA with SNARE-associated domain
VGVSILVERTYLSARAGVERVRWGWIILANVLSASACVGLLILVVYMRGEYTGLRHAVTPYHGALQILAGLGSVALFIAAFVVPGKASLTERSAELAAA